MAGKNRAVRVVTVALDGYNHKPDRERFEFIMERMEFAAYAGPPDIVCTPECFLSKPEPVPGPAVERLSEWAREHHAYVIGSLLTEVDGRTYNSAVLIDRRGEVVGRYDKIHLTEGPIEKGQTPGPVDVPVFETDFGTIGVQICYDVNWPEYWRRLKEKGAEIVFWPSAYPATRMLSALAWINQYYVASSTRTGHSHIFDISGEVLSRSGVRTLWTDAVVHLGKRLFEIDYHISKAREIERKYGPRVGIVWLHEEDWWTLTSLDPDLATEDVIKEFELTPLTDYQVRARKANDRARPPA